jgi:membrane-associated PAP2 superfamily phosphatase
MTPTHIKRIALAFLFLVAVNSAFVDSEKDTGGGMLIEGLLFSLIALMWLNADARQRQVPVTRSFKVGVILISGVFIPVYLLKTRGWRAGAQRLGVFLVHFIGISLSGGIIGAVVKHFAST